MATAKAKKNIISYPRAPHEHPFDLMTYDELESAVKIIHESGKYTTRMRFITIGTREPEKNVMRAYKTGESYERLADVVIIDCDNRETLEIIISLSAQEVTDWKVSGHMGQPLLTIDEFIELEVQAKMNRPVEEALRKRGLDITERGLVCVDPFSVGYYSEDDKDDRRLVRGYFYMRTEVDDNNYAHPIDGLSVIMDLHLGVIIDVVDDGVYPVPQQMRNYDRRFIEKFRDDIKPLEITQPEGPSFTVNKWSVEWQRWSLRVDYNCREGLVLRDIRYDDVDKGQEREIAYRASVAEMTVPYGGNTFNTARKNAFDAGEYGLGMNANSLSLGCDCLGEIHYFDFDFVDTFGNVESIPNVVCMHEEDDSILWKHTDVRSEKMEVRRGRKLIISFVSTIGNYEYGFYWILRQDGSIELEVKAIGVVQTGAIALGETPKYGTLVEDECYAINHQHFFCARLDMQLDGVENQVVEVNTKADPMGPDNPLGNAFYGETTVLKTEKEAKRNHNIDSARYWAIQNPNMQNRMGGNVAYKIMPTEIVRHYFQPGSSMATRGAYLDYHLWVTPYDREENFPAGQYPNQNPGPDGLAAWTEKDRSIENTDLVVWYVFGHHHIPRLEDWPMMPTAKLGFHLKPSGFFDMMPCLDVPPSKAKECGDGDERGYVSNRLPARMKRDIRRRNMERDAANELAARKKK